MANYLDLALGGLFDDSSLDLQSLITSSAERYGVPPQLALAMAQTESTLNQNALSPKGAIGIMQLMPDTARMLGVDPTDPRQNIDGGMRYLRQHFDQFGDWRLALAAYHAGPGAVAKARGMPNTHDGLIATPDHVDKVWQRSGLTNPKMAQPAAFSDIAPQAQPELPPYLRLALGEDAAGPAAEPRSFSLVDLFPNKPHDAAYRLQLSASKGAAALAEALGWAVSSQTGGRIGGDLQQWGREQAERMAKLQAEDPQLQQAFQAWENAEGFWESIKTLGQHPALLADLVVSSGIQMLPMLPLGMGSAAAGGLLGRITYGLARSGGVADDAAAAAAKIAATKTGARWGAGIGTSSYEGIIAGASSGAEAEQFLISKGMDPAQAREVAANAAFGVTLMTMAMAPLGLGGLAANVVTGSLKASLKNAALRVLGVGAVEGAQETGQGFITWQAQKQGDPTLEFDPGKEFAAGVVAGSATAAPFYGLGALVSGTAKPQREQPPSPITNVDTRALEQTIGRAQTLDEALAATQQLMDKPVTLDFGKSVADMAKEEQIDLTVSSPEFERALQTHFPQYADMLRDRLSLLGSDLVDDTVKAQARDAVHKTLQETGLLKLADVERERRALAGTPEEKVKIGDAQSLFAQPEWLGYKAQQTPEIAQALTAAEAAVGNARLPEGTRAGIAEQLLGVARSHQIPIGQAQAQAAAAQAKNTKTGMLRNQRIGMEEAQALLDSDTELQGKFPGLRVVDVGQLAWGIGIDRSATIGRTLARSVQMVGRALGRDVHFFEQPNAVPGKMTHGFSLARNRNVIFLNVKSDGQQMFDVLFGHEFFHTMPDEIRERFIEAVRPLISPENFTRLKATLNQPELSDPVVWEEIAADLWGNRFSEKENIERVLAGIAEPTVAHKLLRYLRDFFDKIIAALRGPGKFDGVDEVVSNLETVRNAWVQSLQEYLAQAATGQEKIAGMPAEKLTIEQLSKLTRYYGPAADAAQVELIRRGEPPAPPAGAPPAAPAAPAAPAGGQTQPAAEKQQKQEKQEKQEKQQDHSAEPPSPAARREAAAPQPAESLLSEQLKEELIERMVSFYQQHGTEGWRGHIRTKWQSELFDVQLAVTNALRHRIPDDILPKESERIHLALDREALRRAEERGARTPSPEERKAVLEDEAESNPFKAFLMDKGVAISQQRDIGLEESERGNYRLPGFGLMLRDDGLRLEELAKLAFEAGFLTEADINNPADKGGLKKLARMIRLTIADYRNVFGPVAGPTAWKNLPRDGFDVFKQELISRLAATYNKHGIPDDADRLLGNRRFGYIQRVVDNIEQALLARGISKQRDASGNREIDAEMAEIQREARKLAQAESGPTPAPVDQRRQSLQRLAQRNPFLAFLAEHGVAASLRHDLGLEDGRRGNFAWPGAGMVLRSNGLQLDELAHLAVEEGFLTEADLNDPTDNGGTRKLADMINRAIALHERIDPISAAQDAELAQAAQEQRDAEMLAEARALGIDTEGMTPDQVYDAVQERYQQDIGAQSTEEYDQLAAAADRVEAAPGDQLDALIDQFWDAPPQQGALTDEEIDRQFGISPAAAGQRAEEAAGRAADEADEAAVPAQEGAGSGPTPGQQATARLKSADPEEELLLRLTELYQFGYLGPRTWEGFAKYRPQLSSGEVTMDMLRRAINTLAGRGIVTIDGQWIRPTRKDEADEETMPVRRGKHKAEYGKAAKQVLDSLDQITTEQAYQDAYDKLHQLYLDMLAGDHPLEHLAFIAYNNIEAVYRHNIDPEGTDVSTPANAEVLAENVRHYLQAIVTANPVDGSKPPKGSEAPEHVHNVGKPYQPGSYEPAPGDAEVQQQAPVDETLLLTMPVEEFKQITDDWASLFAAPGERVVLDQKARKEGEISIQEAQERLEQWKAHVREQRKVPYDKQGNSGRVVISLFDLTGEWSRPWEEAGYHVVRFDIQSGEDVMNFSAGYFIENYDIEGLGDVYAVLAACPCTDFSGAATRYWKNKDADGRTEASKELVHQTLRVIEFFRPKIWAIENPAGRIASVTGLPEARLSFHPHHFGEPYTKRTMIYGRFHADLPVAPVAPVLGSKTNQHGGGSQATKNARSETAEGFAYAFFMANNYLDLPAAERLAAQFPDASGAVRAALKHGVPEQQVLEIAERTYEYNDGYATRNALMEAVAELRGERAASEVAQADNDVTGYEELGEPGGTMPDEDLDDGDEDGNRYSMQRRITNTPEFKRWYRKSKVVDGDGRPVELYHGTDADFVQFDTTDFGAWLAEKPGTANRYTEKTGEGAPRVLPVYANITRPFRIPDHIDMSEEVDADEFLAAINAANGTRFSAAELGITPGTAHDVFYFVSFNDKFFQALKAAGFDGIRALEEGDVTWNAFDAAQIRPAFADPGNRFSMQRKLPGDEIGTRLPTAVKKIGDPATDPMFSDYQSMRELAPVAFEKAVNAMSQYETMPRLRGKMSVEQKAEAIIEHMAANLVWLHDQLPEELRARAMLWYDGANRIVNRWGEQFGVEPRAAAGVVAVLSPKKDWFQNVTLAERLLDIWTNHQDARWTRQMESFMQKAIVSLRANNKTKTGEPVPQERIEAKVLELRYMRERAMAQGAFRDMDPETQAFFVRAFSETYHEPAFRVVTPEGDFGDWVLNADGKTRRSVAWQGYSTIAKALSVLKDPSYENISVQLGDEHKVRNFYNNIIAPNSPNGYVTVDTHAISAGHLYPFSLTDTEVTQNFGGKGSGSDTNHGFSGVYPINHEAVRRAAERRGILPRQMQSITWEAIRALVKPEQKRSPLPAQARKIWKEYRDGKTTLEEARARIVRAAGGFATPAWAKIHTGQAAAARTSSYQRKLAVDGRPDARPGRVSGTGIRDEPATGTAKRRLGNRFSMERGGEERSRATPGANVERLAGLLGPQLYGDMTDMAPVTVKELFQNAFDALKAAIQSGQVAEGKINIDLDRRNRTIRLKDNGTGMTPEVINKAFLTIAGTSKETDRSSGGFGIAKMLFLFGNKNLSLVTVRNGVEARLETTGGQLMKSFNDPEAAPEIITRRTDAPSGTTVTVTVPETFRNPSTGTDNDIDFPDNWEVRDMLKHSPLFENITVELNGEALDIGARFPKDDYTTFATVEFDWGTARVIISKQEQQVGSWQKNLHILSNGLWQFSSKLQDNPFQIGSDPIPRHVYVNVEPRVRPEEPGYPFALNRQGFSPAVSEDFKKIFNYLSVLYGGSKAAENAAGFGQIQYLTDDGSASAPMSLAPEIDAEAKKSMLHINEGDKIEVVDGRMRVNGREVPALTAADLDKVKVDFSKYKIDQGEIDPSRVMLHDNLDVKGDPALQQAIAELAKRVEALQAEKDAKYAEYTRLSERRYKSSHKDPQHEELVQRYEEALRAWQKAGDDYWAEREKLNELKEQLEDSSQRISLVALMRERHGARFDQFVSQIGQVFRDLRNAVAKEDPAHYAGLAELGVGVSFDGQYYGVHTMTPFRGMFINPAMTVADNHGKSDNLKLVSNLLVNTMVHEITHFRHMDHSTDFISEMQRLHALLVTSDAFDVEQERAVLQRTLSNFKDIYEDLNRIARSDAVVNRGVKLRDGSSYHRRDGDDAGNLAGVSAGKRRRVGGQATRRAESAAAGQDGGRAGRPAGKAGDIRFSFSRDGLGELTPQQAAAVERVLGRKPTAKERWSEFRRDWAKNFVHGVLDSFAPIKELSQRAYILARMSRGGDSTLESLMLYGKVVVDKDGFYDSTFRDGDKPAGFATHLAKLKGEHQRFLLWVAAQRAERLKAIGLENLFSDADIRTFKGLDGGNFRDGSSRKQAFAAVLQALNDFNDSVLKIAADSGLIDAETRETFRGLPYIPFYRLQEEGIVTGFAMKPGLVNQQAWKSLKGGTEKLNEDLLANLLQNWSHLITASARNRAAKATIEAAQAAGLAVPLARTGAGERPKHAVAYRENGKEQWFRITDYHLFEAVSALEAASLGVVAKPFIWTKQLLTKWVTISPTFKVRNTIRDSLQAVATGDMSYNIVGNVRQGWKLVDKNSEVRARMLASGAMIRFGSMLEGNSAARADMLIKKGVDRKTILDTEGKVNGLLDLIRTAFDAYQELGDRGEQVNRAALYKQLRDKNMSHGEASFWARDLMDFSSHGKWAAVRALAQTVPFLNARLQGLYKQGRAARSDFRRFGSVLGAIALWSVALAALQMDDDDWNRREEWDKQNYWWIKVGDIAYRIPKPFELGAMATIAEYGLEYMFNDEMGGKRFLRGVRDLVLHQLSMNPVPQLIRPIAEVWTNEDWFMQRPIESAGMARMLPQDRSTAGTSAAAQLLGSLGLPDPAKLAQGRWEQLSPVQIDHLVKGYFGWVGIMATTVLDYGLRPLIGEGERPSMKLRDVFIAGNFVETLPTAASRYVTAMYQQAREIEEAYASYREALRRGDTERALEVREDYAEGFMRRRQLENAQEALARINRIMAQIESSSTLSGDTKRRMLDSLSERRNQIAVAAVR